MTGLIADADVPALTAALGRTAGRATALARSEDVLLVAVRGDETVARRHHRRGAALDTDGDDGRRHTFGGDCSAAGLHELIGATGGSRAARPEEPPPDGLDAELAAALPGLAATIADRIAAVDTTRLSPAVEANATRIRTDVLRADGTVARDDVLRLELRIGARVRGAASWARALRVVSGDRAEALVRGDRHLAAADDVARRALERIEAVDPPEGEFPVVLGPGSPAALLHEVCGHGAEADVACAPGAAYGPPLGRRVASGLVTIVDDPRMPEYAPLYRTDDEGHPAGATRLVEDGVLTGWLADADTSRRTGHPATGNGRRLDHTHPALTRMSCTYLAAGEAPRAEALAGVRRGLYVRSIVAGETNMSGHEFAADVVEGFLIEDGRTTAPVRSATLHGTGLDVLRGIDVVADDLEFLPYGFSCNKHAQYPLTVSVGQPTVRVARMAVSG